MPEHAVPSATYPWANGTHDGTQVLDGALTLGHAEWTEDGDTEALYHFHDGDADDATGSHDLTPTNSPTFDGEGMHCDPSSSPQYAVGTLTLAGLGLAAVTVDCWFRLGSVPTATKFLFGMHSNLYAYWTYAAPTATLNVSFRTTVGLVTIATSGVTWEADRWYHFRFVWAKGGACTVYVDGVSRGTGASADADFWSATTTFAVGDRYDGDASRGFDGTIDEFRVSTVARSDQHKLYGESGTYTSEEFDAGAAGATWSGLSEETALPGAAWRRLYVRAGNTSPLSGDWAEYAGGALPTGRYFQWKMELFRDAA